MLYECIKAVIVRFQRLQIDTVLQVETKRTNLLLRKIVSSGSDQIVGERLSEFGDDDFTSREDAATRLHQVRLRWRGSIKILI